MIIIDKSAQKMTVTVDGEDRYTWPVSTGRSGYDTPSGDFQPFRMERDHFSREWDDAPMPNSIFFTKEGHAIHGTFEARNLGRAASHGCVRLSTQNAATLYALVKEEGVFNTRVRLVGEAPKDDDAVARRNNDATAIATTCAITPPTAMIRSIRRFSAAASGAGTTTARVPTIIARNRIMYAATTAAVITHSGGERGRFAMIRKLAGGKYRLYSRKRNPRTGKRRNLGTFSSKKAAQQHEREIQYFKRH